MNFPNQSAFPELIRVKPGVLDLIGIYLKRARFDRVVVLVSEGLPLSIVDRFKASLEQEEVEILQMKAVGSSEFGESLRTFRELPDAGLAVVGLGGARALDVAKYVAFLARKPFFSVPTSISCNRFCSPHSTLVIERKNRMLSSAMPLGIVIDTDICLAAPQELWLAGVGDLMANLTALVDWKLAYYEFGILMDDYAEMQAEAAVNQFVADPHFTRSGTRLLASSLIMSGIGMMVCGSARPSSGSEHLISHALDSVSKKPMEHGLQVGVATYIVSRLQGGESELIAAVFTKSGFWSAFSQQRFRLDEWLEAVRVASSPRPEEFSVLSSRDCVPEVEAMIREDPLLQGCFFH